MAADKAKIFQIQSSEEDGEAYMINYEAHREGISMEEVAKYYSDWARKGTYEEVLGPERYRGPNIAADYLCESYPKGRDEVKVLDIAAGTGLLGEELWKRGFQMIDGLDPSDGMLEIARNKDVYQRLICDYMSEKMLDIEDDTYDAAVVAGGMGEGHIPCAALDEMIRIVNPGGLILIVMREEYLHYVKEYKDRLEPKMRSLEKDGRWTRISRSIVPRYSFDNDGVVFKYRKS